MAKLTPDATRTEHGLVINEKIIPWGAVWPKDSGAYKKGAQYKADRLLSGGTGKVKGVTIHNTNDLKNVEEDAEQYGSAITALQTEDCSIYALTCKKLSISPVVGALEINAPVSFFP